MLIASSFLQVKTDPLIYMVDDFNGGLSEAWKGRYDHFKTSYKVVEDNDKAYLSAKSDDDDCFIIKKVDVDIVEYPYLNWRWRINKLPVKGDESVKETCDVAASIAVVLNKSRFFPKSIKYSWSTSLQAGTCSESPFAIWPARCDIEVVGSGYAKKGEWIDVKVNVLEDYLSRYNKKSVSSKRIYAMVIMTDSDNTGTPSEADYDDIYFSKN